MAKGQMKSNREAKKPKANKAPKTSAAAASMDRGTLTPASSSKKKG